MGECFFRYRPTRVVPDHRPLNGRCCCCVALMLKLCIHCEEKVDRLSTVVMCRTVRPKLTLYVSQMSPVGLYDYLYICNLRQDAY